MRDDHLSLKICKLPDQVDGPCFNQNGAVNALSLSEVLCLIAAAFGEREPKYIYNIFDRNEARIDLSSSRRIMFSYEKLKVLKNKKNYIVLEISH